jgi:hypothetical protein
MAKSETVARAANLSWSQLLARNLASIGLPQAFLIVTFGATAILAQYEPWNQPSLGDRANWDYFSQVIVRGGVPYKDVVNIKSPLSAYIGAGSILASRPFGVRDVIAIRLAFMVLIALVCGCTLMVVVRYQGGAGLGFIAAAVVLCFDPFVRSHNAGVQPKTPMVLFGLLSLWAIAEDRPFFAGLCGMLSALSWQPGLLFVGVAALTFSRYLTAWGDLKAVKVLLGAVSPLAILIVYFWAAGALRDFFLWTVHFNATVYGPNELRTISGSISRLGRIIDEDYNAGKIFFYAAVAGIVVAIGRELRRAGAGRIRLLIQSAPRHSVILAALGYLGFCMIDMQGGADLIPLLPFVGIFSAILFGFLLDFAVDLATRFRPAQNAAAIEKWGRAAVCFAVLALGAGRAYSYRLGSPTLKDQDVEVSGITANLESGDKIFVHGLTEVLVLSGLNNASKYFLLDRGKDGYLDLLEPGGFDGWFDRLKAEKPKVVLVDRLKRVDRRASFQSWVNENYEAREGPLFKYYLRRDNE